MKICKIELTDLDLLNSLHELQIESYLVEGQVIGNLDLPPLKETKADLFKSKDEKFGLFDLNNEIKGAIFIEASEKDALISKLVVAPDSFRKGYGRQLVEFALQHFKGIPMQVSTASNNRPARSLYEKLGFKVLKYVRTLENIEIVQYLKTEP